MKKGQKKIKTKEVEISLPTGTFKVGFNSVGTVSKSTSEPETIVREFEKAADTDLFITPVTN